MTVRSMTLHGDRAGGRAVGPPTTLVLPPPDLFTNEPTVTVAKLARLVLLSGEWRRVPKTGGIDAKGDYLLGIKTPAALLFPPAARHALLRRPPDRGCSWCVAYMLAALDLDNAPELTPSDPLMAFLGKPCAACRQRHATARRVAEVRAEVNLEQQLIADGSGPLGARVVTIGRRLGLPRDQLARTLAAAVDTPARPTRAPQGAPAAMAARPVYYRHRGRQLSSAWNGPTLRRAVVPRGRPR